MGTGAGDSGVESRCRRRRQSRRKGGRDTGSEKVEKDGRRRAGRYKCDVLRAHPPGETVAAVVLRGREKVKVDVTLEVRK